MPCPRPVYSYGPKEQAEWGSILSYHSVYEHNCLKWEWEQAHEARKLYEAQILATNSSVLSKPILKPITPAFEPLVAPRYKLNQSVPAFEPRASSPKKASPVVSSPLKLADLMISSEPDSKDVRNNNYSRPIGSAPVIKGLRPTGPVRAAQDENHWLAEEMKGMKPTQALPGQEVPGLAYHGTDGDPFFGYFGTNLPLPDEAYLTLLRDCWEKDTERYCDKWTL